jgi:hypothetical protein
MIDPNSIMHIEDTMVRTQANQTQVLKFDDIPQYDTEAYDIYSDKDFKKYIQDVEKDVRSSIEYRRAIQFLKDNMGMNESAFMDGVSSKDSNKVKIELHHSPFTLFDITLIVFNKRLYLGESLEIWATSKEVCKLHYYLVVGLVALTKTEHELVHNSYLFVPADKVLGDYGKFIVYYKKFMSPEQLELIDRIEEYSMTYNRAQNEIILQNNIITLDTSVAYSLPKFEDVKQLMDQKIEEIKGNGYQLLSVSDEELRDASLQRQVFNNINETSNCVSFNYDLVKPYTEPTNCVTFNKNLIGKYSLNVV